MNISNKKTIIFGVIIINLLGVWAFYDMFYGDNGYDISQSGTTQTKGQFIPEQRTDYIYTTLEMESQVYWLITLGILIGIVVFLLIRKRLRKGRI